MASIWLGETESGVTSDPCWNNKKEAFRRRMQRLRISKRNLRSYGRSTKEPGARSRSSRPNCKRAATTWLRCEKNWRTQTVRWRHSRLFGVAARRDQQRGPSSNRHPQLLPDLCADAAGLNLERMRVRARPRCMRSQQAPRKLSHKSARELSSLWYAPLVIGSRFVRNTAIHPATSAPTMWPQSTDRDSTRLLQLLQGEAACRLHKRPLIKPRNL